FPTVVLSSCSYSLQWLFTGIMVPVGLLLAVIKWEPLLKFGHWFWANGLFWLMGTKIRIIGKENIRPDKNYILVVNHSSIYDIPAILTVFPRLAFIGKEYLIKIPVFGTLLSRTDYIPIDPKDFIKARQSISQSIEKAKSLTIAIFPEGTRTLDGRIGGFKKGFVHIFWGTSLDVLPVTLNGLYELKPKTRFTIERKWPVEAVIHPPIPNEDLIKMTDAEIVEKVRSVVLSSHKIYQPNGNYILEGNENIMRRKSPVNF
ncbi:MAG: lysophospholipid acyltransferase family protein, partial [Candidatus Neomarinimicrobiota bacterium]